MSIRRKIADKLSTIPAGYIAGGVAMARRQRSWNPLKTALNTVANRSKDKSARAQGMKWAGLAAGMTVPVPKQVPKPSKKAFQEYLNKLAGPKWRNFQYGQRTRPYGDYLRAQDLDKFNVDYAEWVKKVLTKK